MDLSWSFLVWLGFGHWFDEYDDYQNCNEESHVSICIICAYGQH